MSNRPRHRVKRFEPDPVALAAAAWVDPYDARRPIEEQFRQAARVIAEQLGWRCWHQHDSRGSDVGWPDEVWARPPRLLFVELKAPDGRFTDEQRDTLELLSRCGDVEVYAIRSIGDRARDQAAIAQLLTPRSRPDRILPRGTELTA